ncbi:MAG: HAD-IC family P-type ATPase [Candidatus Saccharibacteria bacterium]|nr:HAD-IC family P-type ATPase [Candidatus Saccharibacteria bacterium]
MKQPFMGLTAKDVRERKRVGLVNKSVEAPSRTVGEIVRSNLLTYFNFVFLILAVVLALVHSWKDLTFLPIIVANIVIGIVQELRAKQVLDNLKVLNAPVARVVRDYKLETLKVDEIVLDDIIVLRGGDQIPADAVVISGEVAANEALLTGEADEIMKHEGDELLSGSFIVYGECYAKITKVGEDSYAAQLTLKAKAIKTGEQSEIIRSLNSFVKVAGLMIIPIGIIMFAEQFFFQSAPVQTSVQAMAAAVIGMIPEGLFLLASVTLVLSAMRLARQKVMLHDMKSIETLARVDTLCVDKTGTITSDKMNVVETKWLADEKWRMALVETVAALSADTETMAAMKREYKRNRGDMRGDEYKNIVKIQGFSSRYKYSGVQFKGSSFVIGAPELVLRDEYSKVRAQVSKYTRQGARVLVFARYYGKLDGEALTARAEALALVVLENEIRETAPATFKYFEDQGVDIKVISGDDIETVAEIARKVGIKNADKCVDMSKLTSQREFQKAVLENTVFGRVTPAQKRTIVKILKDAGHTVAMTGDGVNDVLALKDADCSVAMASGAQAAVQASQMVLLDSDFSRMPSVVAEGRRVVNNLENSGSLFLVKNLFSVAMSLLAICFAITYPMIPSQVSLVTLWTIGVPSFFLAQIPNEKLIKGKFIRNVLFAAAPVALANLILIGATVVFGNICELSQEVIATLCTMVWAAVGLTNLARLTKAEDYKNMKASDWWKLAIFIVSVVGMIVCLLGFKWWFSIESDLGLHAWIIFGGMAVATYPLLMICREITRWVVNSFLGKYVNRWVTRREKNAKKVQAKLSRNKKRGRRIKRS